MGIRVVTHVERPDLDDRWDETVGTAWPRFMEHDRVVNDLWHRNFSEAPDCQLYLLDEETDEILALGNATPFWWDGAVATLPSGVVGVLPLAAEQRAAGVTPNSLCALQAVVTSKNKGRGLSTNVVEAMATIARRKGLVNLVAPVRPTDKHRYPLMSMDDYMRWTREDGLPFDPWLRVHARLGAEILGACPGSMHITGTIAEWGSWTELRFPVSGHYVVPEALVPVAIDVEHDIGVYEEPNVWMLHRLDPAG